MSYDILKTLGLNELDANSPDFLKTLEQMQQDAWQSLRSDAPLRTPEERVVAQPMAMPMAAGEVHLTDDDVLAAADAAPHPEIPAWDL